MTSPTSPTTPAPPPDSTSLAPGDYTSTIILNRIFDLILLMLQSLQHVAVVQSNRATFLTQWQKAYTDLESQVHTFVANNGDGIDTSSSADMNARDDMNRLGTTYTTTLQNRGSVISDDSKALQSNLSQTNDEVTQQSTIATSILTTLSTILTSIFAK